MTKFTLRVAETFDFAPPYGLGTARMRATKLTSYEHHRDAEQRWNYLVFINRGHFSALSNVFNLYDAERTNKGNIGC